MFKKCIGLGLFTLAILSVSFAQDFSAYHKEQFFRNGISLPYRILYPAHYDSLKKYPVILFLHGAGNWGNDNESQLLHGGEYFLRDSIRKKYPAIIIFPQLARGSTWSLPKFSYDATSKMMLLNFPWQEMPSAAVGLLKALTDSLIDTRKADPARLYIGGLSLGGLGTFDMIERYPGYFAAAFPMSGGGDTSRAALIAGKTAVWIFHGTDDPLISVKYSRDFFKALTDARADVKFSEYPGVKHNSWDRAFMEPELMQWMFSKKKRQG